MVGYGMRYVSGGEVRLQGYTNSDWEGSAVDRKRTLGCCFNLGSTIISWFRKKHTFVALSTIGSEYIATSVTNREEVWLQNLLAGLLDHELETTLIYCDNSKLFPTFRKYSIS
jgi:hypothetical protein